MNYRHAYHAGNFADVLKHIVLVLCLEHLKKKDAPFRVIDTHAGCGAYRLDSTEAQKTGEWRGGIGRLMGPEAKPLPPAVAKILEPYLHLMAAETMREDKPMAAYPGSPRIVQALMRPQDTLIANELHPEDAKVLRGVLARDRRCKVMTIDGWDALKALLPPKERRGLVLIDPPFEAEGELERLARALGDAVARFATGTVLLWYPIKDEAVARRFTEALRARAIEKLIAIELMVRAPRNPDVLNGTGLIVLNAPFTLTGDLTRVLPELVIRTAQSAGATWRIEDLSGAENPRKSR
jgi:23S rRNA (adenine2030-N6)-methyltransferase